MTARSERAVRRADPGAAADRRGAVGESKGPFVKERGAKGAVQVRGPHGLVFFRRDVISGAFSGPTVSSSGGSHEPLTKRWSSAEVRRPLPSLGGDLTSSHVSEDPVPFLYELNRHCGALEILHFLGREGSATRYAMSRQLHPSRKGIDKSISCLERFGLIQREVRNGSASRYELSNLGESLFNGSFRSWPL